MKIKTLFLLSTRITVIYSSKQTFFKSSRNGEKKTAPAPEVYGNADGLGVVLAEAGGLDLLEGEPAASPLLDVVLEGGAVHHGAEQGQGAGSNTGSLHRGQ